MSTPPTFHHFLWTGLVWSRLENNTSWDPCSICREETSSTERLSVRIIQCGHAFHEECIWPWFTGTSQSRDTCPNCRFQLFLAAPLAVGPQGSIVNPQTQSSLDDDSEDSDVYSRHDDSSDMDTDDAETDPSSCDSDAHDLTLSELEDNDWEINSDPEVLAQRLKIAVIEEIIRAVRINTPRRVWAQVVKEVVERHPNDLTVVEVRQLEVTMAEKVYPAVREMSPSIFEVYSEQEVAREIRARRGSAEVEEAVGEW
ncbi:uncharacterized protein BDZ99DRAFT_495043 [Mytilinidion resinicola]|uniref:RING-type domain-containing protein n=1 Tax=Mytilinidion resinicola TaxID=574789 RepID=A0A6A6Z4X1_9PEZI|nr:uncharacterized protein BDZ99DRAFT_495043 [Mytilinidion resinicola]KAF2815225.1 hypothetical protein BDZ99DRAFT_495043 [Mytilinidion resinicola]